MSKIILTESQVENVVSENTKTYKEFENGWIVMETILPLSSILSEASRREIEVNPNLENLEQGSVFTLNTGLGSRLWYEVRRTFPHVEAAYQLYQKVPNRARFRFFSEDRATYLDSYYFDVNLNIRRKGINQETGRGNYIKLPGTIRISNHEDKPKTFGANEANPSFEIDGRLYKFCVSVVFEKNGPGFAEKDVDHDYKVHIFEYKPAKLKDSDLASLVKDILSRETLNVGPGEIIDPVRYKEKTNVSNSIMAGIKSPEDEKKALENKPTSILKAPEPKVEMLPYKMPDGEVPTIVRFVKKVPKEDKKVFVLVGDSDKPTKAIEMTQYYEDNTKKPCIMYVPVGVDGKVDTHRGYYVSVKDGTIIGVGVVNKLAMSKSIGNKKYKVGNTI